MSKTTKILVLVGMILMAGAAFFFLYKKKYGNPVSGLKPRVELGMGHIGNFTDSTIDLTLQLLIDNPLPIGLAIEEFDYAVQMDGDTIVSSRYSEPLTIKSRDSTVVKLPSRVNMGRLKAANAKADPASDSAEYHFSGIFNLSKPLLGKDTIRLGMDRRLPRYRLPLVEVVGYDLEKFRLDQSKVVVQLRFINRNPFHIEFKNPTYDLGLGKQESLAKGSVPGTTKVDGRSRQLFEIPLEVDMGDLLKATGQLIGQGKSLPFKLNFRCKIGSENEMFNDTALELRIDGTLRDLATAKNNLAK